uniref:Uncharacterized protein n=1 Tax=Rhizophora mucronata TaxID=61149 RepID=A0A2P2N1E0_RHIMU
MDRPSLFFCRLIRRMVLLASNIRSVSQPIVMCKLILHAKGCFCCPVLGIKKLITMCSIPSPSTLLLFLNLLASQGKSSRPV